MVWKINGKATSAWSIIYNMSLCIDMHNMKNQSDAK